MRFKIWCSLVRFYSLPPAPLLPTAATDWEPAGWQPPLQPSTDTACWPCLEGSLVLQGSEVVFQSLVCPTTTERGVLKSPVVTVELCLLPLISPFLFHVTWSCWLRASWPLHLPTHQALSPPAATLCLKAVHVRMTATPLRLPSASWVFISPFSLNPCMPDTLRAFFLYTVFKWLLLFYAFLLAYLVYLHLMTKLELGLPFCYLLSVWPPPCFFAFLFLFSFWLTEYLSKFQYIIAFSSRYF